MDSQANRLHMESIRPIRTNRTKRRFPDSGKRLLLIEAKKNSCAYSAGDRPSLYMLSAQGEQFNRYSVMDYGSGLCNNGAPDTIRTYDLQFRKLSLYPAELRARGKVNNSMKGEDGATSMQEEDGSGVEGTCSQAEPPRPHALCHRHRHDGE